MVDGRLMFLVTFLLYATLRNGLANRGASKGTEERTSVENGDVEKLSEMGDVDRSRRTRR